MKAMKPLILGVIASFLIFNSAGAFSLFGKKKHVELPDYVNEEIYIDRLFQASDGVYKLNIAVLIPPGLDVMTVTVMYDQLKEKKLQDLAWVKASYSKSQFLNVFKRGSKEKAKFSQIFPFKKERFVKENYEFEKESPELKYDRAAEQKFVVYKRFHFYQKEIFGSGKKKFDHLLELHFADGTKKAIRIRQELYRDERLLPEDKFLPTLFGEGTKPDPRISPRPVLPKDARNDANRKYEEFLENRNDAIENRNREDYEETMQHLQNTFPNEEIPELDGFYR